LPPGFLLLQSLLWKSNSPLPKTSATSSKGAELCSGGEVVRIVSLRKANKREVRRYEQFR